MLFWSSMPRSAEAFRGKASQHAVAGRRRLLLEAAFWLLAAKLTLLLVPFRRIAPVLGAVTGPGAARYYACSAEVELAGTVSSAIGRAASLLPCALVCLPRALAASQMLYRRGLPSAIHFGAIGGGVGSASGLHAWLTMGWVEVTGFPLARTAREVGVYTRSSRRSGNST